MMCICNIQILPNTPPKPSYRHPKTVINCNKLEKDYEKHLRHHNSGKEQCALTEGKSNQVSTGVVGTSTRTFGCGESNFGSQYFT